MAISNPKALIYIVALLPPFVDPHAAILPQLILLAIVSISIDVTLGFAYIAAGSGLARYMSLPQTRRWIDRGVGLVLIAIGSGILAELVLGGR